MSDPPWPAGLILRDIVRGGVAALLVGLLVAGVGSRVVMRIAAVLVPGAAGATTEAGFVVGQVTLAGSAGLIIFVGLFATLILATLWVVIAPWLPRRLRWRVLAAIPVAVALGSFGLVQGDNIDFVILGHNPLVVVTILALVGLTAPAMTVADAWLDRRLPRSASVRSRSGAIYAALGVLGAALGGLATVQLAGSPDAGPLALTILATGLVTLAWWYRRLGGATEPTRRMRLAGAGTLVAGTALGLAVLVPQLAGALGLD